MYLATRQKGKRTLGLGTKLTELFSHSIALFTTRSLRIKLNEVMIADKSFIFKRRTVVKVMVSTNYYVYVSGSGRQYENGFFLFCLQHKKEHGYRLEIPLLIAGPEDQVS